MVYAEKAANALQCAVTSGFINTWYLIASAYYGLSQFNYQSLVEDNINAYYPLICACEIEATELGQALETMLFFSTPTTYYSGKNSDDPATVNDSTAFLDSNG